ncbi:30S ribosomal protein S15 [Candidatus Peregrinibacteria bacterium]|jgi:small subunit ribosomal protein S15|nr:30S ribosomal protein S15 [Candidatus Peregrinibacteria bacterium]MBT4631412.1 30S ribosomal protein S15 [Candidatus Peregrinibacteria bacterium]MBT5517097.1 30S ribosomal protein S15 [Candidatus Peregrinibacteria bacterium]MBT5824003.1 30S ribosomal protein S15 [Candidatus Peregrinibacteria bacterium]
MNRDQKKKLIKKYGKHDKDTGSAQVQVAILTFRIKELTDHLKDHKGDQHSRKGLLNLVGQRRRHLKYLKDRNKEMYEDMIAKLKLRK